MPVPVAHHLPGGQGRPGGSNDQRVHLAPDGRGPAPGQGPALVMLDLVFIQLVHIVRRVPVFQRGRGLAVVHIHGHHGGVAGFLRGLALADLRKLVRTADHAGARAHQVAQFAGPLLVGHKNFRFVLRDEGGGNVVRHIACSKVSSGVGKIRVE